MMRDREKIKKDSFWSIRYIITLGLITRTLLTLKASLIDRYFGVTGDIRTYNVIFVQIILMAGFIADGISHGLIRLYRKIEEREGRARVLDYINNLINIILVGVGLSLLLVAGFLIYRKPDNLSLILIGLPIILLRAVTAVLGSFLQMKHGFLAGSQGGVSRSMIYVIYLLLVGDRLGVRGLMAVGVLATLSQFYIAWNVTKGNDYKYEFKLDLRDDYLMETFKNIFLIIGSIILYDFTLTSKHSNSFMRYFNGLIISAIITVVYPILGEMHERKVFGKDSTYENFNSVFNEVLIFLLKLIVPILIMILVLSDLIKSLFLKDTALIPNLLLYYGLGFTSLIILPFLFKALMSMEKFRDLLVITFISLFLGRLLARLNSPIIKEISGDIGLFFGVVACLYRINKETKFLSSTYLWEAGKNLIRPGLFMLGAIFMIKLAYGFFLTDLISNEFMVFLLISICGVYVYLRSLWEVSE